MPLLPVINQPSSDPETLELVEMELEEVEGLDQTHTLVDMVHSDQAVLGLVEHLEERYLPAPCSCSLLPGVGGQGQVGRGRRMGLSTWPWSR